MSKAKLDESVTKFFDYSKNHTCQEIGANLISFLMEAEHGDWDGVPSRDKAAMSRLIDDLRSWSSSIDKPDPVMFTGSQYLTKDRYEDPFLRTYDILGVTEDRMEYSLQDLMTSEGIDRNQAELIQRALHKDDPRYKPF